MKLVQFKDGQYGVRKFSIIGESRPFLQHSFLDMENGRLWWGDAANVRNRCKILDKEEALRLMQIYIDKKKVDKGTVVRV